MKATILIAYLCIGIGISMRDRYNAPTESSYKEQCVLIMAWPVAFLAGAPKGK